jgi:hypothetical protein
MASYAEAELLLDKAYRQFGGVKSAKPEVTVILAVYELLKRTKSDAHSLEAKVKQLQEEIEELKRRR